MQKKSNSNSKRDPPVFQNQSYDNFKQRKIRSLYGKRVTMQINENEFSERDN